MDVAVTPPGPVVRLGRGVPAVAHYPPGATFGPRTLRDFEFVWVLTGHAHWHGSNQSIDLRPGQLLLVKPGMRDEISWAERRTTTHAYVHFDLVTAEPLGPPEGWPLCRQLATHSLPLALCRRLLDLGRSSAPDALVRVSQVLSWLLTTFVDVPDSAGADDEGLGEHLSRLATRLRVDWARHGVRTPAVAELAGLVGLSGGHLTRLFRHRFGQGPAAALELVRLARAATLVQRSNLSVAAIAQACGFTSPFHFSRRFARVYEVPPRLYRQQPATDPLAPVVRAGLLPFAHRLLFDDE